MRNLFPLFSAFVAFKWTAAEPVSKPTGNSTQDDHHTKSPITPHLKVDQSDALRYLGPHGPGGFEDDHVHSNNEERSFWSSMSSTIADAVSYMSRAWRLEYPGRIIDPERAQVEDEALHEKLKRWILHLKLIMNRAPTYTTGDAIKLLRTIGGPRLPVKTLVRYRNDNDVRAFADSLLRALIVENDDTAELVLKTCLEARVHPEEVFHLLPIAEDISIRGIEGIERHTEIRLKLAQWTRYVHDFSTQQGVDALERVGLNEASSRVPYQPEPFVVDTLMKSGDPKDVVEFFESLQSTTIQGMSAEKAQRWMLAKYRDETEKLILEAWASFHMIPAVAYPSMPFRFIHEPQFSVAIGPIRDVDIYAWLRQVLEYVDLYRKKGHTFSDNAVVELLHNGKTIEELLAYLRLLNNGRKDDIKRHNQLLKAATKQFQPTQANYRRAKEIFENIPRGNTPGRVTE